MDKLAELLPYFLAAVGLTAVLTPCSAAVARRLGAVVAPGGRHLHVRATPLLGGLGIALSFALTVAMAAWLLPIGWLRGPRLDPTGATGLIVACCVILLGGVWDDLRGLRPATKLGYQVLAAWIAYRSGAALVTAHLPVLGVVDLGWLALPASVLWIVGITNAINLLDGLDGLAAGVSAMIALAMGVVAISHDNPVVAALCVILAGASAGFLVHNFYPARVFMGDVGSNFVGFAVGCLSLVGYRKSVAAVGLAASFIILGLPVLDMLFSVLRRTAQGRSPFSADRGHLHHMLVALGLSQRRVVLLLYTVTLALGVLGTMAAMARGPVLGYCCLGVLVLAALTYRWFGFRIRNAVLRDRAWYRAVMKTRRKIEYQTDIRAIWRSLTAVLRMMGFASAEFHLFWGDADSPAAVFKRSLDPGARLADENRKLRIDLGREDAAHAQLILSDPAPGHPAQMMNRVSLMRPVLEALDGFLARERTGPQAG